MSLVIPAFTLGFLAGLALSFLTLAAASEWIAMDRSDIGDPKPQDDHEYYC